MNTPTVGQQDTKTKTRDTAVKTFAGVGLVVVLIAAGWVGVSAIKRVPNVFRVAASALSDVSLFSGGSRESLFVTSAPKVATTTETVTITWDHQEKESDGSYTFTYDCKDGLLLEHIDEDNDQFIFCNTPNNFVHRDNSLTVRVLSEKAYKTETQLIVNYYENGSRDVTLSGETTLVVINPEHKPEEVATTTPALGPQQNPEVDGVSIVTDPTPSTPLRPVVNPGPRQVEEFNTGTTTAPRVSDPNGKPDLSITILGVGMVDTNGIFTAKDALYETDNRPGVQFRVTNLGTKESGSWEFEADLPTRPSHRFDSRGQDSLFPGESIVFAMGFTRLDTRDNEDVIRIELDPDDDIVEASESNNIEKITVRIEAK